MNANQVNWKRVCRNLAIAAVASVPMFAMADVTAVATEAAKDVDALEAGLSVVGAAVVGIACTIKGYTVIKRMVNKV